jgi:hypothetical protein
MEKIAPDPFRLASPTVAAPRSRRLAGARLCPAGQPTAFISAANRSADGTSSSTIHRSGSKRRRRRARPGTSASILNLAPKLARHNDRPAGAGARGSSRIAAFFGEDHRDRSGGRIAFGEHCAEPAFVLGACGSKPRPAPSGASRPSRRTIAVEAAQRDVRAHEGAGAARAFLAVGIDEPRLADEHPPLAARPSAPRRSPGRSRSGRVKTRLKAVVSRKRSLTRLLQA